MAELVKDPRVLPLAFHVDYWDRLGWKDTLGSHAYTQRQYAYASALGNRLVWTPQFIVQGAISPVGNFRSMVQEYVTAHKKQAPVARLTIVASGGGYVAKIEPLKAGVGNAVILVAGFTPRVDVKIERGENAGRTVSYVNTVHTLEQVGRWNGRSAVEMRLVAM